MTLQILVVDDNARKRQKICSAVRDRFTASAANVVEVPTASEAATRLRQQDFDLMILDIAIPLRENETPRSDGGILLLEDIIRAREYRRPKHILGLTAYPKLQEKYEDVFKQETWFLLRYDDSSEWDKLLRNKLNYICDEQQPFGSVATNDRHYVPSSDKMELMTAQTHAIVPESLPKWQILAASGSGLFGCVLLAFVAFCLPNPTTFQLLVFRVLLSLSAAGFAAILPGFISIRISNWIRAGSALAVFVLIYLTNPPALVCDTPSTGEQLGPNRVERSSQGNESETVRNDR